MKYIIMALVGFYSFVLYSQSDSGISFYLPQLKITQKENGKTVIYDFEKEKNLIVVSDSSLFADPDKYKYSVNIKNIKKISIRDGTYFWKLAAIGAAIGGGFGVLLGIAITYAFNESGADIHFNPAGVLLLGIAFAVPTGLILGLFGAANLYYEIYPFTSGDVEKKRAAIIETFKKHGKKKVRIIR